MRLGGRAGSPGELPHRNATPASLVPVLIDERRTAIGRFAKAARRLRRLPVWFGYRKGPSIASAMRKWWVLFRNPHADIRFEGPVHLGPGFSLHMPKGGSFIVGPDVEFRRGFRAEIGPNARIVIGAGCYFTYDAVISCDTSIEIGERCGFSQALYMTDGNHRYRDLTTPMLEQGYDYRPLKIEDDVQIFAKCTITNSIGTRSVIGANSIVVKPVPPYCLSGGVPAKVIEYFGPPGLEPEGLYAVATDSRDSD
jgi:acetyltransferase-like isoleucine patch superfamily enzyme